MSLSVHLRVARPVSDPVRSADIYCRGLGFRVLYRFADHDGFDGVMVGSSQSNYHFEFTRAREHPIAPAPTPEDLIVFYMPEVEEWRIACSRVLAAGFLEVSSFNPYWDVRGRTYADHDGYRLVLQNSAWPER